MKKPKTSGKTERRKNCPIDDEIERIKSKVREMCGYAFETGGNEQSQWEELDSMLWELAKRNK